MRTDGPLVEPPVVFDGLCEPSALPYITISIAVSANILSSTHILTAAQPAAGFSRLQDHLVLQRSPRETYSNRFGGYLPLNLPAKYTDAGLDSDTYWFVHTVRTMQPYHYGKRKYLFIWSGTDIN